VTAEVDARRAGATPLAGQVRAQPSMTASSPNQRGLPRLAVDLTARRQAGTSFVRERVLNLSTEGLLLMSKSQLTVGASERLVLKAPDQSVEVTLDAEVVRVQSAETHGEFMVGLQFAHTDPKTAAQLELLLIKLLATHDGQRSGLRFSTRAPAFWRSAGAGALQKVTLVDLSLNGALIAGPDVPPSGARGLLSLDVKESGPGELVAVPASVIWVRSDRHEGQCGLSFDGGPAAAEFVARVVRELLFSPSGDSSAGPDGTRAAGSTVGGFELGEIVARGRHCMIYRAKALEGPLAGQSVALRQLHGSPEKVQAFSRRFHSAVQCSLKVGRCEMVEAHLSLTEADEAWLATEWVEGWSLERIIRAFARWSVLPPVQPIVSIALEVLSLMQRCHAVSPQPIVHADLRPSSILIRDDGCVKVGDFGGVVAAWQADRLPYLAPELAVGTSVATPQTDIYQLGVVLYEALTGSVPFKVAAPRLPGVVARGPVPPSRLNPRIPTALERMLLAALQVSPANRPTGVASVLQLLSSVQGATGKEGQQARAALLAEARQRGAGSSTYEIIKPAEAEPPAPPPTPPTPRRAPAPFAKARSVAAEPPPSPQRAPAASPKAPPAAAAPPTTPPRVPAAPPKVGPVAAEPPVEQKPSAPVPTISMRAVDPERTPAPPRPATPPRPASPPRPPPLPLKPLFTGAVVGGYTMLGKLAAGGMAEVWVAAGKSGGPAAIVAFKALLGSMAQATEVVQMFLTEARIAALLHHPAVVQIFDVGLENGRPFMAMEYVPGRTVAEISAALARKAGLFPERIAAHIIAECCRGLQAAHTLCDATGQPLHLVHRDVTQKNILLGYEGAVKLLDFGIAQTRLTAKGTAPGALRGTVPFVAPEQILGQTATLAADLFALGVNLYAMLAGRLPFDGDGDPQVMMAILEEEPVRPSTVRPDVDPELERIALTALSKSVSDRYSDAAAMAADLDAYLATHPVSPSHLISFMDALFPSGVDPMRTRFEAALTGL
jgi:serine/threonine protein kinase